MSPKLNEHEILIAEFLHENKVPLGLRGADGRMDGNRPVQERVVLLREKLSVSTESPKHLGSCTWTGWSD